MSITKRQKEIMNLLEENSFLTVKKLSALTYTSESSIRRDLTALANLSLIKRTHGGANILNNNNQPVALNLRMKKNIIGKKIIAKKSSELLKDGQTIMLDGSSTSAFLIPHISKHKGIVLFTNNMITAINAINYGITTHCIGGSSVNNTPVLCGIEAYEVLEKIHPDILFFSSQNLDKNGFITDPSSEENYLRSLMIKNAKESVFLCDSDKFGAQSVYTLVNLNNINYAVFDKPWSELKTNCHII